MRVRYLASGACIRGLAVVGITALGLLAIVGSGGGGGGDGNCGFFSDTCTFDGVINYTLPPMAYVQPLRVTAQAGGAVAFSASASGLGNPEYQWQRSTDGGRNYADIAGASSADLRLANVQVADDGALFRVVARQGTSAATAILAARLAVSSLPGVVFRDGDFQPANWQAAATATPAQGGPTHSEERLATGGRPDAFRHMVHAMPPGPSTLSVFHSSLSSTYDPAVQGAVYVIDYTEDCKLLAGRPFTTTLMLEQGARRYLLTPATSCGVTVWATAQGQTSLVASDFVINGGPACTAGESCPDFSATAAPLRFGYVRASDAPAGAASAAVDHGIDNWTVTVWRH